MFGWNLKQSILKLKLKVYVEIVSNLFVSKKEGLNIFEKSALSILTENVAATLK